MSRYRSGLYWSLYAIQLCPFYYQYIEHIQCQTQSSFCLHWFLVCFIFKYRALVPVYTQVEDCMVSQCMHMLEFILRTRRHTFLYNYNPIIVTLRTHSTERPFLNLALSRASGDFSSTICTWLSRQIVSRLSRRQWHLLSRASFPFYYGIWQEAGPTPQSCSLTVYCGAITSLPIWSTPSLHSG